MTSLLCIGCVLFLPTIEEDVRGDVRLGAGRKDDRGVACGVAEAERGMLAAERLASVSSQLTFKLLICLASSLFPLPILEHGTTDNSYRPQSKLCTGTMAASFLARRLPGSRLGSKALRSVFCSSDSVTANPLPKEKLLFR
jgi:hypothetical protein